MKNVILSSSDRPFGQFWDYGNDNVSLSVTQVSKSNPHSKLEPLDSSILYTTSSPALLTLFFSEELYFKALV